MSLDHMIHPETQIGSLSALEQMIALGDIEGQVQAFLLSCKVDELSPATLRDYAQKLRALTRFCRGLEVASTKDITASHVRLFLLKLQETNSPVSIHDYYRVVKRFFNWLVEEEMLEHSPMSSIRPPRMPRKIVQPFTMSQIADLLCDSSTFIGARNKAIVLTFLDTGLRLGELAGIQVGDIDLDRETIKVMGKGAKERVVRIGKKTQKAVFYYLLMRKDSCPCLWVNHERKPLTAWGIQLMIRRLGRRAGITEVRCSPHTFRHTFGTQALLNGAGEFEVQSLLGHSTLTMTRRYVATLKSENAIIGHRQWSPVDNLRLK